MTLRVEVIFWLILTLIEREDDTRSRDNFLIYFSHNVNLRGWGYIFIVGQDSQTYVEMLV
jgi:hypothetical protein